MALPLLVIDRENKKAGAPLPKMPTKKITEYLLRGIVFKPFIANGNATTHDILMRKQASSRAVKPSSDFLIRIYDVPHIIVSKASSIQFCTLWGEVEFDKVYF